MVFCAQFWGCVLFYLEGYGDVGVKEVVRWGGLALAKEGGLGCALDGGRGVEEGNGGLFIPAFGNEIMKCFIQM